MTQTMGAEVLDDTVFRSVAVPSAVERAMTERLDAMLRELGERAIGGGWDPQKDDILSYTTGYLDERQSRLCRRSATPGTGSCTPGRRPCSASSPSRPGSAISTRRPPSSRARGHRCSSCGTGAFRIPSRPYRRFLDSVLDAVGIRRLEKELEAQLESAERLADYFHQQEEKRSAGRRDILLFIITLLGVFSLADFLALLDTTDFHGQFGFIRLPQDGRWQDLLVLILFGLAVIGGAYVLVGIDRPRNWLRRKREGPRRRLAA